ncbi:MAG: sulfur carrier protein ThiS adenylyltransferase ThiF [Oscillospiraceae bacterium]|nr:sulfur carrier protein ThiS adenylyltransferase ThiF [Oscillospiraceae bacterium]
MNLKLNGREITTDCKSLFALREAYRREADVVILNGYQTNDDLPLQDGDIVSLIQKGCMPSEEELESMMCARHTPFVHEKVKGSRVAIAGLGGLGSNIAVLLARTGVGHLLLVDFDVVEPSNLNRQSYFISHLGLPKTEAMKAQLAQINPFLQVETKTLRVTSNNAVELFREYPIVCEAFDNPTAKAELINTLLENCPEKQIVAASGMAGYGSSNAIRTRRMFQNLYVCGDGETAAQVGNGLMAPRVTVCAAHQANMVLRLILGIQSAD